MGIPDLEGCNIPEHPDINHENVENWPMDPGTANTLLRFNWDEEITDIDNWMGVFCVYQELRENGHHYSVTGSDYLKDILKDDLLCYIELCWMELKVKVEEYRANIHREQNVEFPK